MPTLILFKVSQSLVFLIPSAVTGKYFGSNKCLSMGKLTSYPLFLLLWGHLLISFRAMYQDNFLNIIQPNFKDQFADFRTLERSLFCLLLHFLLALFTKFYSPFKAQLFLKTWASPSAEPLCSNS